MKTNKEKIIDSALKLFNENGMVNVRLQHISDDAIVSVGNMAYHYPNKAAILLTIYQDLVQKQRALLAEYKVVPLFQNIDHLIRRTFHLQEAYIFFYLDTLEIVRANEEIAQVHTQHINWQIAQLRSMLDFNVSRGALLASENTILFDQLAEQLWMTMDFWRTQQLVRAQNTIGETQYKSAVWALLIPHFTAMGKLEYQQMLQSPYDLFF